MAKVDTVALKRLTNIKTIQDDFIGRLDKTYTKLNNRLTRLISIINTETALTDVSLAQQQIESLLVESGYFEEVGDLVNEGYQQVINESFLGYQDIHNRQFQFSNVSLQRMDILKDKDFSQFSSLADDAEERLSQILIDTQFGAMTRADAINEMLDVVDNSLKRHTKTWINTATNNLYTESNNRIASDNGLNRFKYLGPVDSVTRPFGLKWIGKILTIIGWDALRDDPSRDRSAPLPVSTWLTGWNHRGSLYAVG